ncbi:hypothetical protein KVA01_06180 [Kocuria varians]|uniref:Protein kinase domain-containing protein n=1 Tax=Kocuria varians TaxID=1272 RepID=A0A4Y4D4H4_KOCVA|nr:serine/threonine-protein kinase [Kocuria varians]GEC98463.1 hypothetical protein KVA01_06180 [Kocuria varians]
MRDTIAGRFELLTPIAEGGSGAVWRAQDLRLGKVCAAKVLRQRDSADLLRFVREQSVHLEHPHVVAPYGWAAEDEHVAIAMELVSGGTLEAALQDNGPVSDALAEEFVYQLLEALQFVHARGWVHRDVKPANVLLEPTGSAPPVSRLADFGIAVRTSDARLTHTGTVVGTPGYLPHEAYAPGNPSPALDLYAAGVTAVRLVLPEVDLSGDPLGPDDVARLGLFEHSPVLRSGVAGLLSRDPEERVRASEELVTALLETAPEREGRESETADGEPFEVFDVLEPTTERELSPVADAARLPSAAGAPEGPIAWHAVHRKALLSAEHPVLAERSGDPLRPFGPADPTEEIGAVPGELTVAEPVAATALADDRTDPPAVTPLGGASDDAASGLDGTLIDTSAPGAAGLGGAGLTDAHLVGSARGGSGGGFDAAAPGAGPGATREIDTGVPGQPAPPGTGTDAAEARVRRRRPARWSWWLLALMLAVLAVVAGYVWLGPVLSRWGGGADPAGSTPSPTAPAGSTTPATEEPGTQSTEPQPTTDATSVCTELDDGTVSCVVTP